MRKRHYGKVSQIGLMGANLTIDPNMFHFDHTQRNIKWSALNHRIYVGLIQELG